MKEQRPVQVWDAFNIDLFVRVLKLSILHPLFSMWVPIVFLAQASLLLSALRPFIDVQAQGYHSATLPFQLSVYYFWLTLALACIPWSSAIWTNRAWREKSWIHSFFGGPTLVWDEQIVVVTGGAGGIGSVLISTLAVMGATVICIDREEITAEWDDVYSYKCDLASEDQIEAIVKRIQQEVGHPTILIQNAGVVQGKLLTELTAEDVQKTFAVNVLSQFSLIRLLLPDMIKRKKGHVVTVSSVFGLASASQLSDYCASKHALMALHESVRLELRHRHGDPPVRTTLVCPGRVQTPLFETLQPETPLVRFFLPTVEPYILAKEIVAALETEQSREIYLPRYGNLLWMARGLPSWAKEFLEWSTSANHAMKTWTPAGKEMKKDL